MKFPLFFALLYNAIDMATTGFCAHFCQVPYRLTMRTVLVNMNEWSLELMSPIQTILRKTEDVKGARRKLSGACQAMKRYRSCLDSCTHSLQKQVILIGMGPWSELCSALDVRHTGMEEFLRCFKEHSVRIDTQCLPYEVTVKELLMNATQEIRSRDYGEMGELCLAMQEFEECYKNAERPCEEKAKKMWHRLQHAANKAFREMIAIDFISQHLPLECKSPQLLTTINYMDHTQPFTESFTQSFTQSYTQPFSQPFSEPFSEPPPTAAAVTEIAVLTADVQPTNLSSPIASTASTLSMRQHQQQSFMYSSVVFASAAAALLIYCQSIT